MVVSAITTAGIRHAGVSSERSLVFSVAVHDHVWWSDVYYVLVESAPHVRSWNGLQKRRYIYMVLSCARTG